MSSLILTGIATPVDESNLGNLQPPKLRLGRSSRYGERPRLEKATSNQVLGTIH